ncbi:protein phosphatase [Streptomyces sp. AcH 505]|uniref:protein-tyrosine phosphatase family protein n=1 Tax=Streptomyces sp. AcH 505 TaxID=352211 RepID=UPI000591C1E9|nr:protein phosphatase [Streptomyces sp. AcH 505]
MNTRQKDHVPAPQTRWDEIRPGLWMGGHVWTDTTGLLRPVVVTDEFDLVVSAFTRPDHGPDPGVDHLVGEIPDASLTPPQIRTVQTLATTTADAVRDGRTALVRCYSGYNRSGLIVAQTLMELDGLEAEEAIDLIRRRRSSWAFNNGLFEHYLTTGLDITYVLTDLDLPD